MAHGAHVGICLDGDADRVMILDQHGKVADGDQIMAMMAARWAEEGRLRGGALVATVMSNLGLERFLEGRGLRLERTAVCDSQESCLRERHPLCGPRIHVCFGRARGRVG